MRRRFIPAAPRHWVPDLRHRSNARDGNDLCSLRPSDLAAGTRGKTRRSLNTPSGNQTIGPEQKKPAGKGRREKVFFCSLYYRINLPPSKFAVYDVSAFKLMPMTELHIERGSMTE